MITLYQYCNKCKTQRNFDVKTLKCKKCNSKNRNHETSDRKTKADD